MIKGVVKGRSLTIIGTDGDVFTSGSVGLKIKFTFDDEWDGLVKQAVFQNGSNAYISTAINDEVEVPWEVLSIPGRVLRIGIRGTNGTTLVIPTIYAECRIYEGSDKNGAAGQEWSPSEVDQVLSAVAAIDNKVGDLDDLLTTTKSSVVGAINEVFARPIPTSVSDDLKEALLQLAQKVAYIDEDGQNYYDDLYYALYPGNLISITATYDTTHKAIVGDTLDSLRPYLTVIAFYDDNTSREVTDYTLSGSLSNAGNNTIQVYYIEQLTAMASITIPTFVVTSISAVFAQGETVVYDTDTLDGLKSMLVVTATYDDESTAVLDNSVYTLNGTLTVGTSTITVNYAGKTASFNVTVSHGFLYTPDKGLLSEQDYVTSSDISDYFTESVSGEYLNISSPKSGQSTTQASSFVFGDMEYNSSAMLKIVFSVTDMVYIGSSNTTTPGTCALFVKKSGESGRGVVGFARYNATNGAIRVRKSTGTSSEWLTQTISTGTTHTLILTIENDLTTATLDGVTVFSGASHFTGTYVQATGIRIMRSNYNIVDINIKSVELRVE